MRSFQICNTGLFDLVSHMGAHNHKVKGPTKKRSTQPQSSYNYPKKFNSLLNRIYPGARVARSKVWSLVIVEIVELLLPSPLCTKGLPDWTPKGRNKSNLQRSGSTCGMKSSDSWRENSYWQITTSAKSTNKSCHCLSSRARALLHIFASKRLWAT